MGTSAAQHVGMNLLSIGNKIHVLSTPGLIPTANRIDAAVSYLELLETFKELTWQIFSVQKKDKILINYCPKCSQRGPVSEQGLKRQLFLHKTPSGKAYLSVAASIYSLPKNSSEENKTYWSLVNSLLKIVQVRF